MMSQILKSLDFTKTQKSRYLEIKSYSSNKKKIINDALRATSWQKDILQWI